MDDLTQMEEGSATFMATPSKKLANNSTVLTKDAAIFYNPVMKLNRDVTLCLLDTSALQPPIRIADILAGSGIRSIRILKEFPRDKIELLLINDISSGDSIKENLRLSGITDLSGIEIESQDAILLLPDYAKSRILFNYIDIDPFGSPNHFLKSSVMALASGGILAVTATDTAALCGSSVKACRRKYHAEPLHTSIMNEVGLRILIRHVQLTALEQKRSLIPVLSYAFKHYMRVYFKEVDDVAKVITDQHRFIQYNRNTFQVIVSEKEAPLPDCIVAGPVWIGKLQDDDVLRECLISSTKMKLKEAVGLIQQLLEEEEVGTIGFYDLHGLAEINKTGNIPKSNDILDALEERGFIASRTHFLNTGIKTNCSGEEFTRLLLSLAGKQTDK